VTRSHRGLLGVRLATVTDINGNPVGAIVLGVVPGSPAEQGGVQPGDIVIAADSQPVTTAEEVEEAIAQHQPGDRVTLRVHRADGDHTLTVTLGQLTG
jgi:S1-C subfamily serine protease